ncbi:serine hydrolase domain-containing protein [Sphingomonas sp. BK235]|uniref:serine hydrolase domain-containing protein n=1 Tax=Sphingomonas sp. BK235 TaxID=2512131 RepID=UPI00104FD71D|nr:serine hydrolase domain-containing protein [Sphingomonas sp. BK235]
MRLAIPAYVTAATLLVAALSPAAGQMASVDRLYESTLSPREVVDTLSHYGSLYPSAIVAHGRNPHILERDPRPFPAISFRSHDGDYDLNDYLSYNRVAGLLVLKDGRIAYEHYDLGIDQDTHWASFSMAKSFTSVLAGVAVKDGFIGSVDDPVVRYVPALKGSGYDKVSVRQVMQMASGLQLDETYADPRSDRRQLLARMRSGKPHAALDFIRTKPSAVAPGTRWQYNSGEGHVLAAVVENATGKPLWQYLRDRIWIPAGMASDATWWLDSLDGGAQGTAGLTATLQDYGRFGLFAASNGVIDGRKTLPDRWFAEAGAPHAIGGKTVDYGYMWWVPDQADPIQKGAYEARGMYGQYIYVNPAENVVIVALRAPSKGAVRPHDLDDDAFFAAVTRSLRRP